VQGIATGLTLAMILIIVLEICRFFRRITNILSEIDELKRKINNIEELLNNQSK
jgi:hypothetical protein